MGAEGVRHPVVRRERNRIGQFAPDVTGVSSTESEV
jgi:hypothetical protein